MKNILIIGGTGNVGVDILEKMYPSIYNITVLDLESRLSKKRFKKYKEFIKIIYGDIEDYQLIQDLIQKNDIVINLSGIIPPLANLSEKLSTGINYNGPKNIVDAINAVNPKCFLIQPSFISIYGNTKNSKRNININTKTNNPEDLYSINLTRTEEYIKSNLKKYIILRLPIILTPNNYFIRHIKLNKIMDFITIDKLSDILIEIIRTQKAVKQIYNISGFKANSNSIIEMIYKNSGDISIYNRYIYYGEYKDSKKIYEYLDMKEERINDFENFIMNKRILSRYIIRFINLPKYLIYKIKKKKHIK